MLTSYIESKVALRQDEEACKGKLFSRPVNFKLASNLSLTGGSGQMIIRFRICVRLAAIDNTVELPIKDTLKEDNLFTKDNLLVCMICKRTSQRGQPLYKGQKAESQVCPLLEVLLY